MLSKMTLLYCQCKFTVAGELMLFVMVQYYVRT